MFSKTERDYLSGNLKPNRNYEYKIQHSIRKKLKIFYQTELPLIESWPEARSAGGTELGKLTSYQAKLTPLTIIPLIMIKYLNHIMKSWMHVVLNAKRLPF